MKKFTVFSSIALIFLLVGMLFYVNVSKDFKEPQSAKPAKSAKEDESSPVYKMKMKDIEKYLGDSGLLDVSNPVSLSASGLCSEAMNYNGVEIYWWDVKNLSKKTDEYKYFQSLKESGTINLYNSGSIISPPHNGPFALNILTYSGNVDELVKVFMKFGGK